ncbi:DNA-binding LacI/PurR family transcriptional regulator [Microbacterium endophyticum]|uniref:DNA-binding LacI/PurR family transcriptional regulator n=1 Tax=Microbacterium endophyticum TaxID=1526412 RepID=A0A7W4V4Y1_9MICO|nr:LacI family DNA-binding transcriptional regulator [Microbacterium endophyticum]MBB2976609.1 DNA-binding LacI/PurR family transcriptional regulator [Microbacterium endophyticum]NIK37508.1 DNA-binding LacI/PurR family transcriptional regulator [Microbacterium endophyticum]
MTDITPREPRARAARQSDVARLAGVSQSAVSRVISGDPSVSRIPEETRKRIQEAIAALGYVPNPVARNLRGKRTQLLGVHTFEPLFPNPRESFYFEFLLGIEQRAEQTGHDLVLFSSTGDGAGARRIYREETNRLTIADGSVLLGMSPDRDELARLWRDGYPFIHIGRREVAGAPFPCVVPDYWGAAAEIVRRLYDNGHRSIVYVRSPIEGEPYDDRRSGYREAVERLRLRDDSPGFTSGERDLPDSVLEDLVSGRATAAVVESEGLAVLLHAELTRRGVSIPRDVSVAVLEDTSGAGVPWSDLRIPRKEIGTIAVDRLIAMVEDPAGPRESVLVACDAVHGETIAAARNERDA